MCRTILQLEAGCVMLEEHVQNYLTLELDHRRRTQYGVVREPEVAQKAKPDIRLLNPRCGGRVTLELKIMIGRAR